MMCDESFEKSARKLEFNFLRPPSLNRMGRKSCANCLAYVLSEMRYINSTYACVLNFGMTNRDSFVYQGKKGAVLGHVN